MGERQLCILLPLSLPAHLPPSHHSPPHTHSSPSLSLAQVWAGHVRVPDVGSLDLCCCYLAGMGDLQAMLGEGPLDVKVREGGGGEGWAREGVLLRERSYISYISPPPLLLSPSLTHTLQGTVRLEKFEPFLEEVRSKSKSRTVTLGSLRLPIQAESSEVRGEAESSEVRGEGGQREEEGRWHGDHTSPQEAPHLPSFSIPDLFLTASPPLTPPSLSPLLPPRRLPSVS
jgi:hypothetical protein